MALKTRVLYFSGKGKMAGYAAALAERFGVKEDVIPPAYPCDKEKLVILGVSAGKNMPDLFCRFCKELSPARTASVALYVDGSADAAASIVKMITDAGSKVVGDVFYCKGGLSFRFAKKLKPQERSAILAWADQVADAASVN